MSVRLYSILDPMPFGKNKGELIGTLIEELPDRIAWYLENTDFRLDEEALKYLMSAWGNSESTD